MTFADYKDFQDCVNKNRGKVGDPQAYCASIHKKSTGQWPGEKKETADESQDSKNIKIREPNTINPKRYLSPVTVSCHVTRSDSVMIQYLMGFLFVLRWWGFCLSYDDGGWVIIKVFVNTCCHHPHKYWHIYTGQQSDSIIKGEHLRQHYWWMRHCYRHMRNIDTYHFHKRRVWR